MLFGKQRPAVVVQSPVFLDSPPSVTVCLLTGSVQFINPVRILLKPTKANGLDQPSLIQIDKIVPVEADRIRNRIGVITRAQLAAVDAASKLWLGIS
jgi:mRNA-degrading endonuclease toxin of MazEF toxin-antitoxin module